MFTMPHKDAPLVAVVGCSAIKADTPAHAREFYRSPLFKAALAYAEARTKHVVVVSAYYGIVQLDQVLQPYDLKLTALRKRDREDWGARTVDPLTRFNGTPPILLLLCGEAYADAILHGAHWHNLPRPMTPMAKMKGVGNRIAWLNAERTKLALEKQAEQYAIWFDDHQFFLAKSAQHASELQGKHIGHPASASPPGAWHKCKLKPGDRFTISEYGPRGEETTKTLGEWLAVNGEGFLCNASE